MPPCPSVVVDLVGADGWEPVPDLDRHGRSPAPPEPDTEHDGGAPGNDGTSWTAVDPGDDDRWMAPLRWRVGRYRVTRAPSSRVAAGEADRIRWLSEHLAFDGRPDGARRPAAGAVVLVAGRWLVSEGPAGEPADRPERHPEPDRVPGLVGAALRDLHRLDPGSCPFRRPLDGELVDLAGAAAAGWIDPAGLPAPYDRYPPEELVAMARAEPPGRPGARPDLVVGHGRPLVGHVLVDAAGPSGLLGLDRLAVVERHHDLAVAHRHIQTLFGGEAVFGFYEGYGRDPDLIRLDRAVLVDVLDAAVAPPATAVDPAPGPTR